MKLLKVNLLNNKKIADLILLTWFATICTLGPNLLSKVFIPPSARLLFSFLLVIITALIFTKIIKLYKVSLDASAQLLLISFLIYIIGLIVGSIADSSEGFSIRSFLSQISRFYVFGIVFFSSRLKLVGSYMNFYSNFLFVLAFLSIILWFLVVANVISPIDTFTNTMGAGRERIYQNYGIGLMEANILAGEIKLPRAISFYDEPGTFGMMILPALYWSILVEKNLIKVFFFLLAVLLSFSVGTWLILVVFFIFAFLLSSQKWKKINKKSIRLLFNSFLAGLLIMVAMFFVNLVSNLDSYNWITDYASRKLFSINPSNSEGAISRRVEDLFSLSQVLLNNPFGFGANSELQEEIERFSVGIVGNIVRTGVLGLLSQLLTYLVLILMVIRSLQPIRKFNQQNQLKALSLSILSFIIMSFQRISFLSFFSGIFICALFVLLYVERSNKINQ